MSTVATDSPSALGSPPMRGRGAGRGRSGRARGRGRGSFQFPTTSRSETAAGDAEGVKPTSDNGHHSSSEAKRRPFRKASNARRASTTGPPPDGTTASVSSKPALEKELPPHIAGAAVDAESLVSRVRELAINGHAHTSSVESRFSTHLNWADEEDDPDSLPDLDDWAIPSKVADAPEKPRVTEEASPSQAAVSQPETEATADQEDSKEKDQSTTEDGKPNVELTSNPALLQSPAEPTTVHEAPATPKSKARQGLEASIWASAPSPSSPPPNRTGAPRGRHARSASHRPPSNTNQTFHPTHFSRNSVANPSDSPRASSQQEDSKSSPRKPHSRPIISGAALANISRTLGRDTSRQPQSTPT